MILVSITSKMEDIDKFKQLLLKPYSAQFCLIFAYITSNILYRIVCLFLNILYGNN
jgi:hypothetical protein